MNCRWEPVHLSLQAKGSSECIVGGRSVGLMEELLQYEL